MERNECHVHTMFRVLKVGFGVDLAFQAGIHGAAGEQTLVWFEIAGGA